jgi:hypothetical protein
MKGFKENFINLKIPKEGYIRVTLSELNYYSEIAEEWIVVPIGLETDLGSIPSFLQGIFPKDGLAVLAYILHDYLYKSGIYSRSISDDILKEAMKTLGVGVFTMNSVRAGLAVGGWVAWNKHRENEKALPDSEATYN